MNSGTNIKLRKFRVYLKNWDFDASQIIESTSASKAKGIYISQHLKEFKQFYTKQEFFGLLRYDKIK